MDREALHQLQFSELLTLTQTDVTPDAQEGFSIATLAYERALTPIEQGKAARQAGFRAEQARQTPEVVKHWFDNSRSALSADDAHTRRELIATELLTGRALALRIERVGSAAVASTVRSASNAFARGEAILQDQHAKLQPWDRFGTMLARHRATHEAMNGAATLGAATAVRGLWRAIRAEKEGEVSSHAFFVAKQFGANLTALVLATSKPLARVPQISSRRHRLALKLLG